MNWFNNMTLSKWYIRLETTVAIIGCLIVITYCSLAWPIYLIYLASNIGNP